MSGIYGTQQPAMFSDAAAAEFKKRQDAILEAVADENAEALPGPNDPEVFPGWNATIEGRASRKEILLRFRKRIDDDDALAQLNQAAMSDDAPLPMLSYDPILEVIEPATLRSHFLALERWQPEKAKLDVLTERLQKQLAANDKAARAYAAAMADPASDSAIQTISNYDAGPGERAAAALQAAVDECRTRLQVDFEHYAREQAEQAAEVLRVRRRETLAELAMRISDELDALAQLDRSIGKAARAMPPSLGI